MAHSTLHSKDKRNTPSKVTSEHHIGPRAATIQLILGYSRALRVVDAPPIGKIEVILN